MKSKQFTKRDFKAMQKRNADELARLEAEMDELNAEDLNQSDSCQHAEYVDRVQKKIDSLTPKPAKGAK